MKREFKQGDRVLVRKSDMNEWVCAEFEETDEIRNHFVAREDDGFRGVYMQCRHLDDFRTGDLVQIKSEDESEEWRDAVYACELPQSNHWPHSVYNNAQTDAFAVKYVRWHPSMPWADKEELTLEQRVEALERKLNELCG